MNEKPQSGPELKLMELFEEGKRFTQDLLKENEKLRLVNANLRNERKDIESQYVKVDVPLMQHKLSLLEQELLQLRGENRELREQFRTIEEENRDFAERYIKVERQNSDLISLYVASHRLHSTLDYNEVLQTVKEIVINMVGAEVFGVYLVDSVQKSLMHIASEGLSTPVGEMVPIDDGMLGKTASTGQVYVAPRETDMQKRSGAPIACIPLKVGEQVMGVIAIFTLLMQKDGFQSVDFELFELLGGHAATAIYVSRLYSLSERKRSTLEGFLDLLRDSPQAG